MAETEKNNDSIFSKAVKATKGWLDDQIIKSESKIKSDQTEEDFFYSKAVTEDPTYRIHSQGYKDKPHRLMDSHLKMMSLKNSVVAAIIQTEQNLVASHSALVKNTHEKGFRIVLKNENTFLEKIKEELREEMDNDADSTKAEDINKADDLTDELDNKDGNLKDKDGNDDDNVEEYNWELERKAKEKLKKTIEKRKKVVEDFITNCGKLENRPFETEKWNFDSYLRAIVRDTLTYDRICTENVPDNKNELHHILPVDASTIKYASPQLSNFKEFPISSSMDFLYPEKQLEYLEDNRDVIKLDEEKLANEEYKWVQVIKGKIERAYTAKEMKVGMRNVTTDIYNNGYSIAELELLVGLVSSHLNTEYYNQSYFTQGFSAKGLLHIKAPINRRKLESVRQQWHHMLRGSKNSFQTPIFAGVDDVNWIPLTQSHSDIEFQGWMTYLIKMICAIYQIDPQEIGYGMKEEGSKGAGMAGDNTAEKLKLSKNKGLKPLLRFIANYLNINVIDYVDADFKLEFVGIDDESAQEALERQAKEVKFKKTVNEIREEDCLPPIPGMDDVILDPTFMQWYAQFSKKAQEINQQQMQQEQATDSEYTDEDNSNDSQYSEDIDPESEEYNEFADILTSENPSQEAVNKAFKKLKKSKKSVDKPISIEYYIV